MKTLVQDRRQGLRGEGEGDASPDTPRRLVRAIKDARALLPLCLSAQGTCRPQLLADPLWRRPCGEEVGGRVFRRGIATPSLPKGSFPRNQEVTGATLASSL